MTDQLPQPRAKRVPQGWRVPQWAEKTTLSDAFVRQLVKTKRIRSVKAGSARIILTSPSEYLEGLAAAAEVA